MAKKIVAVTCMSLFSHMLAIVSLQIYVYLFIQICQFIFDSNSYVSAMVPVKTMREYDILEEVIVLFCETVNRLVTVKKTLC